MQLGRSGLFPAMVAGEREVLHADAWATGVSDVTVICSASRSGSSVLFRALARSAEVLSPRGEDTPQAKATICAIAAGRCDEVPAEAVSAADISAYRAALVADVGIGLPTRWTADFAGYLRDLAIRIPLQWPGRVRPEDVHRAADKVISAGVGASLCRDKLWDAEEIFRRLIAYLARENRLDPRYYDHDPLLGAPLSAASPHGPPDLDYLIEEPPFIPILPRRRQAPETVTHLLVKSPSLCHRLRILLRAFPYARIRVLHLVRNPAASVNGLIDGWLHWGFFSRDVAPLGLQLRVSGYSERFPWGKQWWNFDAPYGWEDYVSATLEDVCAFQWAAAQQSIARFVESDKPDYLRIEFEDLICDPRLREETLRAAASFMGIKNASVCAAELPGAVMSTAQPAAYRWRSRSAQILRALESYQVREQASALGMRLEESERWI